MKRKTVSLTPAGEERDALLSALRGRGAPVIISPRGELRLRPGDAAALRRRGKTVTF